MKQSLFCISFLFLAINLNAQNSSCLVGLDSLKGSYQGDCKNGKANGEGIATGVHVYTGTFKNGLPEGKGKYTWKNGDYYFGSWKKGLKEGKGELHLPVNNIDSVITGYWKKDMYKGMYENPYELRNNSSDIGRVEVTKIQGGHNSITITVMNLISGSNLNNSSLLTSTRMTDYRITRGSIMSKSSNVLTNKEITIFQGVVFPFRVWMYFGGSNVEIEFLEEGSWDVTIPINK